MKSRYKVILIGIIVLLVIAAGIAGYFLYRENHAAKVMPTANSESTTTSDAQNPPQTTTISTSSEPLHFTESGQYYDIDLEYPNTTPLATTLGSASDAAIVAILDADAQQTAAAFITDSGVATITPTEAEDIGLNQYNKYSVTSTYQTFISSSTVSYVFTISEDTLGAHPLSTFSTYTFNLKTGAQVQLSDLFIPGSGYLNELSSTARALLVAQQGAAADPTDFINPGTTPVAQNFESFALDGTNLDLFFNPYQVGPYSLGPQIVKIPIRSLSDIEPMYK